MKQSAIFWFLFFCMTSTTAQQVFERYYTFGTWTRGNQVLEVPGEGYFIVGINDSLAFDSLGQPTIDYNQGIIVKLNYNGDTLKTFQIGNGDTTYTSLFGGNSDDFFRTAIVTDDGNLLVGGETQSYNAQNFYDYDFWVLKFDTNLDTLWTRQFSVPDTQLAMAYADGSKLQNGGILLPGYSSYLTTFEDRFQLSAFDSLGNLIFYKTILPSLSGAFLGATETSDLGFMAAGLLYNVISNSDLSPIVVKTDSLGKVQWYKVLPYSGDMHYAQGVAKMQNGNYVYTWGNVVWNPGASHKVWMSHATEVDILGNEIWTKSYGYNFNGFQRIKTLPNGNFMITGWYADTLGTGIQALLMLCDSNGDSLWTRKFNGPDPRRYITCMDGTFTSDEGFILTGETSCCNFTPGLGWTSSLWVLKTDSLGLITSVINAPHPEMLSSSISTPYPNPASNKCTIMTLIPPSTEFSFGEMGAYLILFDLQGRQLFKTSVSVGLNQTTIDISNYASGEYLIALSVDGYNAGTKKILVQH